ncbi:pyridoxamine 5'-phosphate oxidase family protein [Chenggangzhangella methanolivorans]|uniref:Pyridoxamine 5'-phosphate oxidase family protein n=2 Tax=Chenggangzhangella methanolivorans TaxID=1437009 RepID=A0A9E6UPQ0_9HYPH|nr:pyridoxamine 5'-phosphate oxidase family protein [Chenggangzhangella methanolivorans]
MSSTSDIDRLHDLVEEIAVCMLTSKSGASLRARPMHAKLDRATGEISFLTDVRHHKDEEIAADPEVCLAFASPKGQDYVSISGRARVSNDRAAIKARFNEMAKVWFPGGPEDANVRLLVVDPHAGEFWDGKSNPVAVAFEIAKARLSEERPDLGENRKVAMGGRR